VVAEAKPEARRRATWPSVLDGPNAEALALQFQFQDTEWWHPGKLLAHQLYQVQNLIDHAQATVPYYKERLAPFAGWPPGVLTMKRFRDIPTLNRDAVRAAGKELHALELPPGHGPTFPIRTSGSSGTPIEVLGSQVTGTMLTALSVRGHLWHKRDFSAKFLFIRRVHPDAHEAERRRWAPVPHCGPSVQIGYQLPISEMFQKVLDEDPAYLEGNPSIVFGLARKSVETGRRPKSLRQILNLGEVIDPWVRAYCQEAWGVPVIDIYSSEEFNTIAHQCPETENLHVQSENVLVEVLDDRSRPCRPGQSGRIFVTSLLNYATPLIRYELGDVVETGARCPCGRGLPVLKRVQGRIRGLLHLPNGGTVFPSIWKEVMSVPKVKQFQLIQTGLQNVVLRLVASAQLDAAECESLIRQVRERLISEVRVQITYVDAIPREPGGKYLEFKSELDSWPNKPATLGT
jgi:phenylacetate-CoA ligase